jgi:hypothetical protein
MKLIFPILFLSLFFAANAHASEIFGTISTNPNQNSSAGQNNQSSPDSIVATKPVITSITPVATGSKELISEKTAVPVIEIQPIAQAEKASVKNVLGIKIYPDGTLLRGPDNKIYLIQEQIKKHIVDLQELAKYRGRPIFSASEEELASYGNRAHINGELIRQKRDVKVYVIVKGVKKHVLNLQELRAHYAGLEIFNIEQEEMALY